MINWSEVGISLIKSYKQVNIKNWDYKVVLVILPSVCTRQSSYAQLQSQSRILQ